jgi:hypothetical protein
MNPGHTVQDANPSCPPGPDDASRHEATTGGDGSVRSPRAQKPVQDIQDIIDKLAAVTQQLRRPGSRLPGSSRLGGSAACSAEILQQLRAVGRGESGRAQQAEGPDVAGDVGLVLQVHTAG